MPLNRSFCLEHFRSSPLYKRGIAWFRSFPAEPKQAFSLRCRTKVLFHHDDAPTYTSDIATAKLFDLLYEILPHPPYSPHLASSDYFLFPNMKTWLGSKRFSSYEEISAATNEYLEVFYKNYFLKGIKKLEYRYNKC